jgi:DNA-binding beta-propeller fold protein YncE
VADTDNNCIQKFDSAGNFITVLGSLLGSEDGQFKYPYGVAVDPSGNVYVADTENHRIQKFISAGWTSIPGAILDSPALAWNPVAIKIQMVVRGSNNSIWAGTFDSSGTFNHDWTQITGATPSGPALAWNSNYPGGARLQMAARATDNSIWVATFNSSGVFNNDWTKLTGATPSGPAVVYLPSGDMCIVVRGLDNSIWRILY